MITKSRLNLQQKVEIARLVVDFNLSVRNAAKSATKMFNCKISKQNVSIYTKSFKSGKCIGKWGGNTKRGPRGPYKKSVPTHHNFTIRLERSCQEGLHQPIDEINVMQPSNVQDEASGINIRVEISIQ